MHAHFCGRYFYMEDQMGDGKENRSRKKPVRIVVKPVYVGSRSMADVFGGVAAENIRRKINDRQPPLRASEK